MAKKKKTGRVHQKPRKKIIRQRRTKKQIAYDKQYETKTYKRSDDIRRDIKMINERLKSLVKHLGRKSQVTQQAYNSLDTLIPEKNLAWRSDDILQLSGPLDMYEQTDLHEVVKGLTKSIPTYQDVKEEYLEQYLDLKEWNPEAIEGVSMEDFIEINESLPEALGAIYDRIKNGTADEMDELAISVMQDKGEHRHVDYKLLAEIISIANR